MIPSKIRKDSSAIGLVVPCFNEAEVIPQLLRELTAVMDTMAGACWCLLVDDGSRDRTVSLLSEVCAADSRFALLSLSRNFGHQSALTAGLMHARGDAIVVLDADLQDPPSLLPAMLDKWKEGYDVVYGVRQERKESWILRRCYEFFYWLLHLTANIDLPLDAGDFCLMDRSVVDLLNSMPERTRFIRGMRGWLGFRQIGLPYSRSERFAGKSKYSVCKLLRLAVDGLIGFSAVPLRLATLLGLASAFSSLCYLCYAIFSRVVTGQTPPGWASLVSLMIFLGGIQLLVMGIVGEYVGRIFEEIKQRPHYIARTQAGWLETNNAFPEQADG